MERDRSSVEEVPLNLDCEKLRRDPYRLKDVDEFVPQKVIECLPVGLMHSADSDAYAESFGRFF
jgi:hypothetical protein